MEFSIASGFFPFLDGTLVFSQFFSLFSTFFMGVDSSFSFFNAVNCSKNILNRLILDSPSKVFPWNFSRFFSTNLVLADGSNPAYSGSSCKIQSSISINLISMLEQQSAIKFFLFFSCVNSIRIKSILPIRSASSFSCCFHCDYSYCVSTCIYLSDRAGGKLGVGSRIIALFLAWDLASPIRFLRPKHDNACEKAYKSIKLLLRISLGFAFSLPSNISVISLTVFSSPTF